MRKSIILLAILLFLSSSGICLGELATGYDLLSGTWTVGATTHNGKLYDVHDVEGLEDIYDSNFLWFDEEGSFGYINLYHSQGSCTPFKENSYLLKTQAVYRYKTDGDGITKEEIESDKKTTYLVEFVGDESTLRFGVLDPFSGKIKADATSLFFVKDGCESSYIAKNKTQVSNSNSSSSGKNTNSNKAATIGEKNALRRAKEYLAVIPFSHAGLVEQLEYEGYSYAEATYGADYCGANWNMQAAKKAADYLEIMAFSRSGLIDQLEYDGFTYDQAVYGTEKNGY